MIVERKYHFGGLLRGSFIVVRKTTKIKINFRSLISYWNLKLTVLTGKKDDTDNGWNDCSVEWAKIIFSVLLQKQVERPGKHDCLDEHQRLVPAVFFIRSNDWNRPLAKQIQWSLIFFVLLSGIKKKLPKQIEKIFPPSPNSSNSTGSHGMQACFKYHFRSFTKFCSFAWTSSLFSTVLRFENARAR